MQAIQRGARPLGVVYTPAEVTEPMVRTALAPLLAGRSADELAALRICDPAIGEGAFLLAVVRVLGEHLRAAGIDDPAPIAAGCVCGVDVDPAAVATARAALGASAAQLQVADALALDWPAAFPDAFARGGFDAVVGNPPYVRQEHLGAHKPRLRGFASYDGVADLYVYFVELAHRIARPGGRFCLITPNKWLTTQYGRALRSHLAAQGSVEGVVDLGRSALFDGADAFPCIVWGTVRARDQVPCDAPIAAARLPPGAAIELSAGAPHARSSWRADPWHIDDPADRALLDQIAAAGPPLAEVVPAAPARGVVTGCNRAFVIDRATRDRLLADEPDAAAVIRPFLKGRDLRRWLPATPDRWILLVDRATSLDALPGVLAHLEAFRAELAPRPADWRGAWRGRKPGSYRWFELQDPVGALIRSRAPRLLYQDIQTAPLCALDLDGAAVPDTTVWMLPTTDRYLLAVLGSPLYAWYARRRFPPALNGAVRPKLEHIRRFPIAPPTAADRAALEALVDERLALARAGHAADELDAAIFAAVDAVYGLSPADAARIRER
ncbi:MAG TPA: Eco57I restriction-modification methylase domain-containing protein [Kofleriaceae bacterium]|nr:Eco57I restriction-modification methylase domain-containing protein [Kofleriaceae bacterium]